MQKMLLLALAASLVLAPAALAEGEEPACPEGQTMTPEGCSQQAWVDDCPPDHMCAAGSGGGGSEPQPYGPGDCIECSGPAPGNDTSGTCMDGADADEQCRDDVQYIGGPDAPVSDDGDGTAGRGPPLCENCRGDGAAGDGQPEAAETRDAPAAGAVLAVSALGAAMLARRRVA